MPLDINLKTDWVSPEKLDQLLDINPKKNISNEKITYSKTGPGQLRKWDLIMENSPTPFLERESVLRPVPKKKIIFSNALLKEVVPTDDELAFISSLIQNYDVILLPDEKTPLSDCKPLSSSSDFWRQRGNVRPATTDTVKTILAQQGMAAQDYLILDYENYQQALSKFHLNTENVTTEVKSPAKISTLDLTKFPLNAKTLPFLTQSINPNQIKQISVLGATAEEIQEFFLAFPELETVSIQGVNELWYEQNSKKLEKNSQCNLTLDTSNKMAVYKKFNNDLIDMPHLVEEKIPDHGEYIINTYFPTNPGFSINRQRLKKLDLQPQTQTQIKNFSSEFINKIKEYSEPYLGKFLKGLKEMSGKLNFTISYAEPSADFLTELPKVTQLTISATERSDLTFFDSKQVPNLTELEICTGDTRFYNDFKLPQIDFKPLTQLNSLHLQGSPPNPFDFEPLVNLQKLVLTHNNLQRLNFPHGEKIKHLVIRDCRELRFLDLSQFPNLEVLEIENTAIERLDFRGCPNLKCLKTDFDLSRSNLSSLKNLETLTIKYTSTHELPEFKHLTSLRRLSMVQARKRHSISEVDPVHIDLTGCGELESFESDMGHIASLNCQNLAKLKSIKLEEVNDISVLNVKNATDLREVRAHILSTSTGSFEMDAAGCHQLQKLNINCYGEVKIKNFDQCRAIRSVNIEGNERDAKEFLRNAMLPGSCQFSFRTRSHIKYESSDVKKVDEVDELYGEPVLTNPISKDDISTKSNGMTSTGIPSTTPIPTASAAPATTPLDVMEQFKLQTQNERSKVACFNFSGPPAPDGDTATSKDAYKATGSFNLILEEQNSVGPDHYRLQLFDDIEVVGDKIFFKERYEQNDFKYVKNVVSDFDEKKMQELQKAVLADEKEGLGYFSGPLHPDSAYPLGTSCNMPPDSMLEIFSKPPGTVALLYNEHRQQYFVHLIPSEKGQNVEVLYRYKRNPNYELPPTQPPITLSSSMLLPDLLIKEIIREFKTKDHMTLEELKAEELKDPTSLNFLFSGLISPADKLKRLQIYCGRDSFKNEPLVLPPPHTDLSTLSEKEKLIQSIKQRRGKCRHRAQAFMLLGRMAGVPIRMIYNELHACCEIPYPDGPRLTDFGGAFVMDLTPANTRKNVFDDTRPKYTEASVKNEYALSAEEIRWEIKYTDHVKQFINQREAESIDPLLKKEELEPLIELTASQDSLLVKQQLIAQLRDKKEETSDFLYIHSARDFELYLHPFKLDKGQRTEVSGPLAKIIQQGGTLIVNWSNFTARQIASFKSILDRHPTLLGHRLSPNVRVIGIKTPQTESCTAFSSRCMPHALLPEFFLKESLNEIKKHVDFKHALPIEINLFHRPDWRDHLLGIITFSGNRIELADGPLLNAIKNNRPLIIHNPPNDPEFKLLINRIRDEKRIFYNGEFIPVPHFNIQVDEQELKISDAVKANIQIFKETKASATATPPHAIHLGLHNWHECFETLHIDNEKKQANTRPGFLKHFDEQKDVFYITDKISSSDWEILLSHIEKNFPTKRFVFNLAPQAEIQGVMRNDTQPFIQQAKPTAFLKHGAQVVLSNDPDYLTQQWLKENKDEKQSPLVLDVSPQTTFQKLIGKLEIKQQEKDKSKVDFSYQEQGVLKAIRDGRTVILNGEMSPRLYQQLQSLFSIPPYLMVNGEKIVPPELKGKVISIMPNAAKQSLPLTAYMQADFSEKDYADAFDSKADREIVRKIHQFFALSHKLPHRGVGFPEKPTLSYHRLKRMLKAINEAKLHSQNPIKGLLLYDYPKHSEDYAYLNVVGKILFRPNASRSTRRAKLDRLWNQLHITRHNLKDNIWRLLNCISNTELIRLLGPDVNASLEPHQAIPQLNEETLAAVWNYFTELRATTPAADEKSEMHVPKRQRQVGTLLDDADPPILMVKGEAGVGKTFTVLTLLKEEKNTVVHNGEAAIEAWLTGSPPGNRHLLLLDEANLAQPGKWDFLKGMMRDPKVIYYNNREYTLSPQHRVILTGNFENYPGRYYHPFIQHYAETLHFKMPEDEYLEKSVIGRLLPRMSPDDHHRILKAYHLIKKHNPTFGFSHRDLENVTQRINVLLNDEKDITPANDKLLRACIAEFAGTISELAKRQQFSTELRKELGMPPVAEVKTGPMPMLRVSASLSIPNESAYVLECIKQALQIRESNLDAKAEETYHKRGLLIEGEPGVGKSTLIKAVLEENGFTRASLDVTADDKHIAGAKRYYEVSAGSAEAQRILLKAFHEGAAVILDELNLDDTIETLLNQLLTGLDPDGNLASRKGFMLFASQNPSHEAGRVAVSNALRNRLHFMYMNTFTQPALEAIVQDNKIEYPRSYVSAYQKSGANTRTFFTSLRALRSIRDAKELEIAAVSGDEKKVADMLKAGVTIPPLMVTKLLNQGFRNQKEILTLLLEKKASPDGTDNDVAPLYTELGIQHWDNAEILLKYGADPLRTTQRCPISPIKLVTTMGTWNYDVVGKMLQNISDFTKIDKEARKRILEEKDSMLTALTTRPSPAMFKSSQRSFEDIFTELEKLDKDAPLTSAAKPWGME